MAESRQEALKAAWLGGKQGYLSALSETKLWAIREVWVSEKKGSYGLLKFASESVVKVGTKKEHPSPSAVSQFYDKIDEDSEWFPGKIYRTTFGPSKVLPEQSQRAIALSATTMKKRKIEPSYPLLVAACQKATLNPNTGKPVDKKRVYDVLREKAFDEGAEEPWVHKARYSKTALSEKLTRRRFDFGLHVQGWGHTVQWFFTHIIWTDICNSVLPRSEQKASDQGLARKGHKGWGSPGFELDSHNLRGPKESLKQNSWDSIKVWWVPILTRGKLHIETFDENFPGETPEGAAQLVAKVRAAINLRFQAGAGQPKTLWTDRGKGFYFTGTGRITPEYKAALAEHGLKAQLGDNASIQPGRFQELMLHETAVAWMRTRLSRTTPPRPWEESRDAYAKRLKTCCHDINTTCDVEGLCKGLPKRIDKLVENEGGRLRW